MPDHCYSLEPDQRLCQGPYAATASRIGLVDTRLLQQSEYDFSQYDVCLVDKGCVSLLSGLLRILCKGFDPRKERGLAPKRPDA